MNDLIGHVTPLTRGIIWLTQNETNTAGPYYTGIDYLLDGLLTANLTAVKDLKSRVVIGKNFGKPLFVMILKEIKKDEIESYLSLLKKDLLPEEDIIVVDECDAYPKLKQELKDISVHIKLL